MQFGGWVLGDKTPRLGLEKRPALGQNNYFTYVWLHLQYLIKLHHEPDIPELHS